MSTRVEAAISWMIRRNLAEVLKIGNDAAHKLHYHPWNEEDFLACLRQRNSIGMVAEVDNRVAGFMIYELHKQKIKILNIAVAEGFYDKEILPQLIKKLQNKLSQQRRQFLTIDVDERNDWLVKELHHCGLNAVSTKRDYFDGADAIAMRYVHPETEWELQQRKIAASEPVAYDTPVIRAEEIPLSSPDLIEQPISRAPPAYPLLTF